MFFFQELFDKVGGSHAGDRQDEQVDRKLNVPVKFIFKVLIVGKLVKPHI